MATPRRQLLDPDNPLFYHIVSRCVRRSWLCGFDRQSRKDYSHRKDWLIHRIKQLGSAFAIDIYAYAIMSNHFHLVVYLDPNAPAKWPDSEVAERWLSACPPRKPDGSIDEGLVELQREILLGNPERLSQLRAKLACLSTFMKLLKQPIARRANMEDGCSGHFFEQRFYSGALLSESAVIAAMAYVDLNPIRANIAKSIEDAEHTSIHDRLKDATTDLESYLGPVVTGVNEAPPFEVKLGDYVERLRILIPSNPRQRVPSKAKRWHDQVFNLKRRQRAFGPEPAITAWIKRRGWQLREIPLPN